MLTAYYLIPEANILQVLTSRWGELQVLPLAPDAAWQENALAVLLRSPLQIQNRPVCLANLWKRHLVYQQLADVKLITLGFVPNHIGHPNYIDLLNLPTNWTAFLENALPADADWEPMDTFSLDLQHKLHRFLRGHDDSKADSLVAGFTRLQLLFNSLSGSLDGKRSLKQALDELITGQGLTDLFSKEEAGLHPLKIWEIFLYRFYNYQPFFITSPIKSYFDQMETWIGQMAPFFSSDVPDTTLLPMVQQNIDRIQDALDQLEDHYNVRKD